LTSPSPSQGTSVEAVRTQVVNTGVMESLPQVAALCR